MKTIHNLTLACLLALLLLAGCRSAGPAQPAAETGVPPASSDTGSSDPASSTPSQGGPPAGEVSGLPALRPTTAAAASLAADFPQFDGLYWTGEVGVEPLGENAVRLMSGMPCADLLDLLSSGEWRAAQHALPAPEQMGLVSLLVLLEKGDQSALIDLKDFAVAPLRIAGEPTPTPAPQDDLPMAGCAGTVQILPVQAVAAEGEVQAAGPALQYPLGRGCLFFEDQAQVSLLYEGPADFRAVVDFTVPQAVGEYSVDDSELSLSIARSSLRMVELFAEAYRSSDASGEFNDVEMGSEFYAESEDAGMVVVRSANPLAGEIILTDFYGENGPQTFRAGFSCPAAP